MSTQDKHVCPCRRIKCVRHGNCAECRAHHHKLKKLQLPWCERIKSKEQKICNCKPDAKTDLQNKNDN